jgi:hypothetical protein
MPRTFTVKYCPPDPVLGRPLFRPGAEFDTLNVAMSLHVTSFPPGTVLCDDGGCWCVLGQRAVLCDTDGAPVPDGPVLVGESSGWLREVSGE